MLSFWDGMLQLVFPSRKSQVEARGLGSILVLYTVNPYYSVMFFVSVIGASA